MLVKKILSNRNKFFFEVCGLRKFFNSLILDERENVQKKTFTKWVNSHLLRVNCKILDLYMDMRDGKMLIRLLEVLSGERLVRYFCRSFSFRLLPFLRFCFFLRFWQ